MFFVVYNFSGKKTCCILWGKSFYFISISLGLIILYVFSKEKWFCVLYSFSEEKNLLHFLRKDGFYFVFFKGLFFLVFSEEKKILFFVFWGKISFYVLCIFLGKMFFMYLWFYFKEIFYYLWQYIDQ